MEDAVGRLTDASASPLVSCVVPVFNGGDYLREAIDSICAQGYRPIEIVAVDDGSTDASLAILASYGDVVRVVQQENAGPAAARNRGVSLARGEFVAFLDQDDHWHADKLLRQVTCLLNAPHIDVSVACVESFWPGGGSPWGERRPDQPRAGIVPGYVTSTMLARRRVFEVVGGFGAEYRYADSLDWFTRAAECGIVVDLLPDVLLYHRVHDGNLSRQGEASRAECVRIIRRALERRRGSAVQAS